LGVRCQIGLQSRGSGIRRLGTRVGGLPAIPIETFSHHLIDQIGNRLASFERNLIHGFTDIVIQTHELYVHVEPPKFTCDGAVSVPFTDYASLAFRREIRCFRRLLCVCGRFGKKETARAVRYHRIIAETWKMHLRVVMVSTRNPLNIGAAARAMANFGFATLRVVQPYDVAFREARSAVGAAPLLRAAEEFPTVADAVADCRLVVGTTSVGHRELQHPIRRLEYGSRLILKQLAVGPVALLFGSEKYGLSNEDLSHCHWLMRIPTVDTDLSMNLGQAVALCLYELARDPKAALVQPERTRRATGEELEQLTAQLLDALRRSGYINPVTSTSTEEKVRRLVRRMDIAGRDAPVLLGMLRQILWKIG